MEDKIDMSLVDELRELMEDDFDILLRTFVSDSETKFNALADAIAAGEAEDLRRTAHSLKGSSSNLGAIHLSELCFELEKMGRDDNLTSADNKLQELKASLDEATVFYQSLLSSS